MVLSRMQMTSQAQPEEHIETAYSLLLLGEYIHTLDSLPLDLSRNFSDLRELDAVLSSSMVSITRKIIRLTEMIEQGLATEEERLWLLTEIAEEATRLKLGGEDKIRVACQAGDNLRAHSNHLRDISDHLPNFDPSVLVRKTTYPHVSAQSFMPVNVEHGRRRRGQGSLLTAGAHADPSPAKRKRITRDDDLEPKSPRKSALETTSRGRTNKSTKKVLDHRGGSPADSIHSANSFPRQASQNGKAVAGSSRGATSASGGKRSRAGASARNHTPLANEITYPDPQYPNGASSSSTTTTSRRAAAAAVDPYNTTNISTGPGGHMGNSAYANVPGIMQAYDMHPHWTPANGQPLEGPGMPVSRSVVATPVTVDTSAAAVDGTDGDGEGDDSCLYCICRAPSYGEMVGCDQEGCAIEWFHLGCVGLAAAPPQNTKWYCDDCKLKRAKGRAVRGGKRRAGGRSGGRA